ncbi:MAG: hypothetical protein ACMUIP_14455 [bacterium]
MDQELFQTKCYEALTPLFEKSDWNSMIKKGRIIAHKGDTTIVFICINKGRMPNEYVKDNDSVRDNAQMLYNLKKGIFDTVWVLIVENKKELEKWQSHKMASHWPGGLFLDYNELSRKRATGSTDNTDLEKKYSGHITIIHNTPLTHDIYKLRFTCPGIERIKPGQFILLDCLSDVNRKKVNEENKFTTHSLLKRPFSIYQTYCTYFPSDYFSKIHLPASISSLLQLPYPDEFEIIYKVKEMGIGTRELTGLQVNDKAAILGPLGKSISIKKICPPGSQLCLVGGGIGVAPLNFLAQSLKLLTYHVKVFIGTDTITHYARECILNLNRLGIAGDDVYLATEDGSREESLPLPEKNLLKGNVAEIFRTFLASDRENDSNTINKIRVFTCGPSAMMRHIHTICSGYTIPCHVMVEERMACGIGVCLSCAVSSKLVCTDGPCFESQEIYSNE